MINLLRPAPPGVTFGPAKPWEPGDAEEWLPIPGFDGYEASSLGQIRSWKPCRGMPVPRIRKARPHRGYPIMRLRSNDGGIVTRCVHQLVALAFLGSRPEGLDTCHFDGNPFNNSPTNLRYDTRSANIRDAQRHGTAVYLRGEDASSAKLTWAEADEIRDKYAAGGVSQRSLGAEYGISHNIIGRVVRGDLWRAEERPS